MILKTIKANLNGNNPIYLFIAFLIIAFILYGNTLPHKYNLDDVFVTNGNPQVKKGIFGLYEIFTSPYSERENYVYGYRPIAKASFALEYSIWQFNPHVSHLINILLYAITLFLLYILLQKIFATNKSHRIWLIILLFASHPIHTEVVSSLKNREELFCFLFGFWSLYEFIRFYEKRNWVYLIVGTFALLLSLLSKQTGVVFIAIIPLTILMISDFKFDFLKSLWQFKSRWIIGSIMIWWLALIIRLFEIDAVLKVSNPWIYALMFIFSFGLIIWQFIKIQSIKNIKSLSTNLSFWALILLLVFYFKFYSNFHFLISILYIFLFIPLISFKINDLFALKNSFKFLNNYLKLFGIVLLLVIVTTLIFLLTERITYEIAGTQDSKLYYWQNPLYFGSTEVSLLANGFNTFAEYCKLLLFPYPLRFYYGYATIDIITLYKPMVWIGFILLLSVFLSGVHAYFNKRWFGYGLLIMVLGIIPFLNFYWIVPGVIAERLAYLASIGFSIAIVDLLFLFSESKFSFIKAKQMTYIITFIIIVFSILTIQRNKAWSNPQTLFETDIPHLSNSVKANDIYAAWLLHSAQELMAKNAPAQQIKSKLDLSLYHYKRTIQIYPQHLEGWNNVGIMYTKYYNNPNEALFYFNKAISYDSSYINPYLNIGAIELLRKNYKNAMDTYSKILKIDSVNAEAYNGIVQSLYGLNDTVEANNWNIKILNDLKSPDKYYTNKGSYYLQNGDTLNAIFWFEKAFDINQNDINLCVFLGKYFDSKHDNKANYYHNMATQIKKSNKN